MKKGEVRIIGGQWRGRKLHFPATPDLRPTPNRIRETLFNWLTPYLADAYCCLLYTSPSPRDRTRSRMPSSA